MRAFVMFLVLIFAGPAYAQTTQLNISAQTSIRFEIPQDWQHVNEPPEALLEEMAEHIAHEAAEKGHNPPHEQLVTAARKRLQANEVLLYNPNSKAYLTLDFSSLRAGERAPQKKSIQLSAQYAGESLAQEEGVTQLTGTSREAKIKGAWYAYRYDANYLHHDKPMHFSGVIGFSSPYWFFFYFTDYLQGTEDKEKAEQLFNSIEIISTK